MKNAAALLLTLAPTTSLAAQTPDSHAASGDFKQPSPAQRFRQVPTRDNLVHPPGYVTAPPGTFGEIVQRGEGDTPVLLIAGLGPSWRMFESLMQGQEQSYRFHAMTLAGYGGSSAPPMPEPGTSFGQGTWLKGARTALGAYMEEKKLVRPIVVAFYSDAARIAVRYALEHPDALGGLLVISASPRFPLPAGADYGVSMDSFADSWFKTVTEIMWPSGMWPTSVYANDIELSEKTWWDVLQPTLPTAIRYTVETWADDLVADLPALKTPAIVLSPGFDDEYMQTPTGVTVRQRFHKGWEDAIEAGATLQHLVVPDARLLLWEDQPDDVLGALEELTDGRTP